MEILSLFSQDKQQKFTVYQLDDGNTETLVDSLPVEFRRCYIDDSVLELRAGENGISCSEFLTRFVLPDVGNVKSGDFGELFSTHLVVEHLGQKGFSVFFPKKWQWKDRNKPSQYSDSIFFRMVDKSEPSTDDFVVTVESKMKAVASKDHRISDAIKGACDDQKTRMAKTINWLVEKYARLGDIDSKRIVERFKDPASYGTFSKTHKAVAIVNATFLSEEISTDFINDSNIGVVVVSIPALQVVYESTHQKIIESI